MKVTLKELRDMDLPVDTYNKVLEAYQVDSYPDIDWDFSLDLHTLKHIGGDGAIRCVFEYAFDTGNISVVKYIFDTFPITVGTEWGGTEYESRLHLAASRGELELVKLCVVYGDYSRNTEHDIALSLCAVSSGNMELLKYVYSLGDDLSVNDNEALYAASELGRLDMVIFIAGLYPPELEILKKAARLAVKNGSVKVFHYLKSLTEEDLFSNDVPPLYRAVFSQKYKMVKSLIDSGEDVNFTYDSVVHLPLCTAIAFDDLRMVKILVEGGAGIHIQERFPLKFAVKCKAMKTLGYLLEESANLA